MGGAESTVKYHPDYIRILTPAVQAGGHCEAGSLTGAVSSKKVTEESKGSLSTLGNRARSVRVEESLTVRHISRAGVKAGPSDPVVLNGKAIAQQIKGTLGITGLSRPRVHIDGAVWHLDVGSSHPGAGEGPKGSAVRRSIAVRELGLDRREPGRSLSSVGGGGLRDAVLSTRGSGWTDLWCTSYPAKGIRWVAMSGGIIAESI